MADRNGLGPLVSPNSHDSLTGLRLEEPVTDRGLDFTDRGLDFQGDRVREGFTDRGLDFQGDRVREGFFAFACIVDGQSFEGRQSSRQFLESVSIAATVRSTRKSPGRHFQNSLMSSDVLFRRTAPPSAPTGFDWGWEP